MTMLIVWLDKDSVALAADSRMTGIDKKVKGDKLHRVQPGRVMFGIGFGKGANCWLRDCPHYEHPYPEYWRDCSGAENVDKLEQFIRNDLIDGGFPEDVDLELWVAGVNEQGELKAFILDGRGNRTKELTPGSVDFNVTSKWVTSRDGQILWEPKKRFWTLKEEKDKEGVEFSGAEALREIGEQLIEFCEANDHPSIGGSLQYHRIIRG
jgi:hypothetical protein